MKNITVDCTKQFTVLCPSTINVQIKDLWDKASVHVPAQASVTCVYVINNPSRICFYHFSPCV